MMRERLTIEFAGEQLELLADRAVFWPAGRALIVADVHLGKDASFRFGGIPVPSGATGKDLKRLDALIDLTAPAQLVVLGDLVHNRASYASELTAEVSAWRAHHTGLDIELIIGNHDRSAGPVPESWRVTEHDEPHQMGPLWMAHHPDLSTMPTLCGHVHPKYPLKDFDRSTTSLPCFARTQTQLLLPAFGSFTGGAQLPRVSGQHIVLTTGATLIPIRA
jgi:uncharacterized protein